MKDMRNWGDTGLKDLLTEQFTVTPLFEKYLSTV